MNRHRLPGRDGKKEQKSRKKLEKQCYGEKQEEKNENQT